MRYYTLKFEPATVSEIKGSKAELIGELQNLIDRIEAMDEELTDEVDMVPLYDMDGVDYITAWTTSRRRYREIDYVHERCKRMFDVPGGRRRTF